MSIWDDIEKADVFTKGKWLEPGLYEVRFEDVVQGLVGYS